MRKLFFIFFLFCSFFIEHACSSESLRLEIMPYNPHLSLLRVHEPLAAYLTRVMGVKVVIYSSASYTKHLDVLREQQYDLAITGPHFAVMAYKKWQAAPLFHYNAPLQPLIVSSNKKRILSIQNLKGKTISIPDRLSMISIYTLDILNKNGLVQNIDFDIQEYPSHGAAIAAVSYNKSDAAFSARTSFEQMPSSAREDLFTVNVGESMRHIVTMVRKSLPKDQRELIVEALKKFPESPEGQRFFSMTNYGGYVDFKFDAIPQFENVIPEIERIYREKSQ